MTEVEQVKMLGDGVLVEKPLVQEKVGSLYLTEQAQAQLLDMFTTKVVAVGQGAINTGPMEIEVGDIAHIVKGPQYATIMLDNKEYWVLAQHNILFVKRG